MERIQFKGNQGNASPVTDISTIYDKDGNQITNIAIVDKGCSISSKIDGNILLVKIPNGVNILNSPIIYNVDNVRMFGEIWGYSNDPDGIYPATKGAILKLPMEESSYINSPFPAIKIENMNHRSGIIENIGINGKAIPDTRGLFDLAHLSYYTAIYMSVYLDQFRIHHINAQGCGCAVAAVKIDACNIDRINADGCDVGVYIDYGYYNTIENNLLSDCLSYAILIESKTNTTRTTRILNNTIVRCGYNSGNQSQYNNLPIAALYLKMNRGIVACNEITQSGMWWYPATEPVGVPRTNNDCNGLYIEGDKNIISSNHIAESARKDVVIKGNNNIIGGDNRIGKIEIHGNNNVVHYMKSVTEIYYEGTGNVFLDYDQSIIHQISA